MLCNLPQADSRVCSNARLLVVCGSCKLFEEVTVDCAVRELSDDDQNRLERLFSYYRCNISEASDLDMLVLHRSIVI